MNQDLPRNVLVERAFWVAAALAVAGGVGPLLVTLGQTNRIAGVFIPFAVAAIAMGTLAIFYRNGRTIAALVYFLAGLAIAYGMLQLLAVPLRLAVLGSCPPAPQRCTNGLEMQLSGAEGTALTIAILFGVAALFAGFIGLSVLYRHKAVAADAPPVWPDKPPEKPPAPAAEPPAPEAMVAEPAPAAMEPEPETKPEPEPEPVAATEPGPEPIAAPAPEPPPAPKPRRKRSPKPAPEAPPEPPTE